MSNNHETDLHALQPSSSSPVLAYCSCRWCHLPRDLLESFAGAIPLADLIAIIRTCHAWRNIILNTRIPSHHYELGPNAVVRLKSWPLSRTIVSVSGVTTYTEYETVMQCLPRLTAMQCETNIAISRELQLHLPLLLTKLHFTCASSYWRCSSQQLALVLQHLAKLQYLEELQLQFHSANLSLGSIIAPLQPLGSTLTSLALISSFDFVDVHRPAICESLRKFTQLRHLHLGACLSSELLLDLMASLVVVLPHLEFFNFSELSINEDDIVGIRKVAPSLVQFQPDTILTNDPAFLSAFTRVRTMRLWCSEDVDPILFARAVAECRTVEELDISHPNLTEEMVVKMLTPLERLRSLSISNVAFQSDLSLLFSSVPRLQQQLRTLRFTLCPLLHAVMQQIQQVKHLQTLEVELCFTKYPKPRFSVQQFPNLCTVTWKFNDSQCD